MAARQKVVGPYRVKNIGVGGDVYEVVSMIDPYTNTYEELRPRYVTRSRQAAYGKCLRLNKRWQQDILMDEDYAEMIEYWTKAAEASVYM